MGKAVDQLTSEKTKDALTHELAALSMDGYALAAGGILVQVPEDQAEDAKEIIRLRDEDTGEATGDQPPPPHDTGSGENGR